MFNNRYMKKILFFILLLNLGVTALAQRTGAKYYADGQYAAINGKWDDAFKAFKAGADIGSTSCSYETALCYERGEGTSVNFNLAFQYMYKAAIGKAPWSYSYLFLGKYYMNGIGTAKNYEEALKWFYKGASEIPENDIYAADCMFYIGLIFTYGWGTKQDYSQAVCWYKKAAELGHPVAALNLGNKYMNGQGVVKDEKEAVKWWRKAAEAQIPNVVPCVDAQYNMGMVYLEGIGGTPIDKTMALKWFKKAAANGSTQALIQIAKLEGGK